MRRLAAIMLMLASTSSWCAAEEIRIEGGGAAIAHVFQPMKESFEKATGDVLSLKQTTPVRGLLALMRGEVDASTAAHPLDSIILGAGSEGVKIDPATLRTVEMGKTRLVVLVHSQNRIAALSKDQLKDIFTGKVSNWSQIGGADLPMIVVWGTKTPGQNAKFMQEILDGELVSEKARMVGDYTSIRDAVASTPGAIGIDPEGFVSSKVRTPKVPLMVTPVILITKGEPSPKVKKLIKFYEEEFAYLQK